MPTRRVAGRLPRRPVPALLSRPEETRATWPDATAVADAAALVLEAARLAAGGLGATFTKMLEHEPTGDTLMVRVSVGWRPGVVGHARLPPGATCPAGSAFATRHAEL